MQTVFSCIYPEIHTTKLWQGAIIPIVHTSVVIWLHITELGIWTQDHLNSEHIVNIWYSCNMSYDTSLITIEIIPIYFTSCLNKSFKMYLFICRYIDINIFKSNYQIYRSNNRLLYPIPSLSHDSGKLLSCSFSNSDGRWCRFSILLSKEWEEKSTDS